MKKILYIHDRQGEVGERRRMLESAGLCVELVADGRTALAKLQREQADLVLVDALVEGPNGFEVCGRLRSMEHLERVPVILLAGIFRGAPYREAAMLAGADAYLEGPLELPELIAEITRAIEIVEREFELQA